MDSKEYIKENNILKNTLKGKMDDYQSKYENRLDKNESYLIQDQNKSKGFVVELKKKKISYR